MSEALHPTRRRAVGWPTLVGACVVLAATWALATTDAVSGAEEAVFRVLNDLPDWLEGPAWPVMQFGALASVPLVAAAAFAAWRRWQPAVAVAGAGAGAWLAAKLIKAIVQRGRPATLIDDVILRPAWTGFGYVSGHTAVAFAMATVLGDRLGRVGAIAAWAAATATGLVRIYVGAHLPLDVVGGAAAGMAMGIAVRVGIDRTVGRPEEAS